MSFRFAVGERVKVKRTHPPGHRRTPFYIRGKTGVVERHAGAFPNPEELAYGFDGLPKRPLYRVRIRQTDIWPDYKGSANDLLELEIYEHWLEPV
jgi:nitrile hydratase